MYIVLSVLVSVCTVRDCAVGYFKLVGLLNEVSLRI
jgi:hypothetical protein